VIDLHGFSLLVSNEERQAQKETPLSLVHLADSMDAIVHQSIRQSLWSAHASADEQLSREITIPNTAGEIV
jgi:hypothetical protein